MCHSHHHHVAGFLLYSAWLLSACGGGNSNSSPNAYSIGGIVSGLYAGAQVALQNNGSDQIRVTANGSFSFDTPVSPNGTYAVTVATQPLAQFCTVTAGKGSSVTSNISSVRIACSPVNETVLHTFNVNPDGRIPSVNAIQGSDGNFYGTTPYGGTNDLGTVYRITPGGLETVLYSFSGGAGDASIPSSALVQGTDGNFYGTAGGGAEGFGTVFKITPAGVETLLYSFLGDAKLYSVSDITDGSEPSGALVQGGDGNFYGTTMIGGANNLGTVYRITPGGVETVLYSFAGGLADGFTPRSALLLGTDGNFYGTTLGGGATGNGIVFRVTPAGVETVFHAFAGAPTDGSQPLAALIQGNDGSFYGTTQNGGASGNSSGSSGVGTVFKITPTGAETVLYSFADGPIGNQPAAALIQGADGNFYGTTPGAGTSGNSTVTTGNGMVFKITPLGAETVIHSFAGAPADGSQSLAGLILGNDGNFYGTTSSGGASNSGSLIKISSAGTETVVYSFNAGREGQHPVGLILGNDGNLYGTTSSGGSAGSGTVFKVTPTGVETVLYSFQGGSGGSGPSAALVQASDGNFYGTTSGGGTTGSGTVFKITSGGVETVIDSFQGGADGSGPSAALVQASDGNLYGTTSGGGTTGNGTVFKITSSGVKTVLYSFSADRGDGSHPSSALLQGTDGNFYGTTPSGGTNDFGTVYKITPGGVETVLHSFNQASVAGYPAGALIEGNDGNFYGTTAAGIGQGGVVFKITPSGVVTALCIFESGANKIYPSGPLIEGSDGNFYGTAWWWDGSDASEPKNGAVFMVAPTGVETTLHSFTGGADGSLPNSLVQNGAGVFYGTTYGGGAANQGTVFTF
jgi:uncharacterized repeat protein (TIGR03803 family)